MGHQDLTVHPSVTVSASITPGTVAAGSGLGAPSLFPDPVGQPAGTWTGVFHDEFTASSVQVVDAAAGQVRLSPGGPIWQCWYPNWPTFTSQNPGGNHTNTNDASYYALSQVSLSGGRCLLTSQRVTTVTGLPYTSGVIQSLPDNQTGFAPLYGFFETKFSLSALPGGSWPAFWGSASAFNTWPPEIDIAEFVSADGKEVGNNVYLPGGVTYLHSTLNIDPSVDHVYGCKWTSSSVTWYVDGAQTTTTTDTPTSALYVIFDLANYAPDNPTYTTPLVASIDYIRVWQ